MLNLFSVFALLTPPASGEYYALLPGAMAAFTACLVILFDVFHRSETSRDYLGYIGALGLGLSVLSTVYLWDHTLDHAVFFGMLYLDRFSLLASAIIASSGLFAILLSPAYLRAHFMDRTEYYILILFAVSGMIFMTQAADLLSFFIGLEVMSIPIYALAAFLRKDKRSAEAGLKYFILGAFSTGLFLYGVAFIYGLTGTTNLEKIGEALPAVLAAGQGGMVMLASMLILSGFAFKIAAAPFHIWTPDVYTGSPTPVVGFMATGVKTAAFIALIRTFVIAFGDPQIAGGFAGNGWLDLLLFFAIASMVLGNFVAITQSNIKRMLAYSSIAHAGYLLLGLVSANSSAEFFLHNDAVIFYLATYTFGTLGAFGVLAYIGKKGRSAETYEDLNGLGLKYPFVGAVMAIFMFSSAGIPPTAGFLGKFYIFRSAVEVGTTTGEFTFILGAIIGVLTSVAGVFYYLRVLVSMYMKPTTSTLKTRDHSSAKLALIACAAITLYFGILPASGIQLTREAIVDFAGAPQRIQATLKQGAEELQRKEAKALNGKVELPLEKLALPTKLALPPKIEKPKAVAKPVAPIPLKMKNALKFPQIPPDVLKQLQLQQKAPQK